MVDADVPLMVESGMSVVVITAVLPLTAGLAVALELKANGSPLTK